jgi:predicted ATPase/class 3 adenylate cyclase
MAVWGAARVIAMPGLPTGTVTFLFTDVEGSTRLWEQYPAEMRLATARHDALVAEIVGANAGVLVRPRGEGDSRFAVFARASDAVAAAVALQQALTSEAWSRPAPLRVRMALHTGEAELRDGDYYGPAVNRCARLRAIAHGGQVLLSQTTHDLVRPALPEGVSLRDLGEHRLADLALPERAYQVLHPGLRPDFPPLRSLEALPNNLPLQLTSFVGREAEIAEVEERLEQARLLTLTGTGGCGKTRLAVQVAADLLDAYPDGIWFVDLAPLADAALVPQAVAVALGLRETPGRPLVATLADHVGRRHLLLLLDNCEHLLDACAHLADALLHAGRHLRILATSREPLGIAGEVAWRVPSLPVPPASVRPALEEAGQFASVRLFAERAAAADPAFVLSAQNSAAVVQIVRRLDGIPLATELAAARVRVLTVEQIAARLDDRFRLLTGGSRTALPRQQTLRATLDWSHDLLSKPERVLFRRLAVFAGSWTLEAAEVVCGDAEDSGPGTGDGGTRGPFSSHSPLTPDAVLQSLGGLVDKSLVASEEQGRERRYRYLETIRAYASERLLEAGETALLRERHLSWCLALAERAEPELLGSRQLELLAALGAERANVWAALDWGLASDPDRGLRLVGALWRFWYVGSGRAEGIRWLDAALVRAPGRSIARAHVLLGLAFNTRDWSGDLRRVQALTEESLSLFRAFSDQRGSAWALHNLGMLAGWAGDGVSYRDAVRYLDESIALFQSIGDRAGVGMSLRDVGQLMARFGPVDEERVRGRRLLEQSLEMVRGIGDCWSVGWTLRHLGNLARLEGDNRRARGMLEESLGLFRRLGNAEGTLDLVVDLAGLAGSERDFDQARRLLASGITHAREIGHVFGVAQCLLTLGTLGVQHGEPSAGIRLISAAVALQPRITEYWAHRVDYEANLVAPRIALGDDAFTGAWAAGQAMTLEQAIAYALSGYSSDA